VTQKPDGQKHSLKQLGLCCWT